MLFSIGIALMIILVAGFWTYQGLFSAAIMFFECVVSALIAFGFYEPLNGLWGSALGGGIGRPLALAVLFLVPLTIMKYATDRFITANIRLNPIADRAVAGVFGLLTSLLLVGTALVGVQMLPIGSEVFGYDRLAVDPDGTVTQKNLLLKPDNFAVSIANIASSGSMSNGSPLATAQPDMLMSLYGARAAVQTEDTHEVPPDCLKVNAYWETRQIDTVTQKLEGATLSRNFETKEVSGGKLLVFNITLAPNAGVKDKGETYFRLPQFRLIGPTPELSRTQHVHLACGASDLYVNRNHAWHQIQEGQPSRLVRFDPTTKFLLCGNTWKTPPEAGKGYKFDIAFEVPDDFEPWYIAYKNGARYEINKAKMFKQAPPKSASVALGNTGPGQSAKLDKPKPKPGQDATGGVGKAPGGATHVADAKAVYVSTKLPVPVFKGESLVSQSLKGGKLGECNFAVEFDAKLDKADEVKNFDVPEGKKLVFLDADKNQALSMYGKALNFASNTLLQITLTTDKGEIYFAQGFYAVAKQGGQTWVEIQYHPEADVPERCISKAKKVTNAALQSTPKDVRRFGYIFVVDPGVHIVTFASGGTGGKQTVDIEVP
ncbi:MAG: CvpA family protein [Planctomycetota bacterium]